jgi:RNA polymerase sigma-70 factor (ECF subfamily)
MRSSGPRVRAIRAIPSAELAHVAREGDRDAMAELYRRTWPRALAAVRSTSGWDEAEDAVAEGFVRALDRLDQLRSPGAVEAWMTRCALRASIDLARRRRRVEPGEVVSDVVASRGPHAESAAEGVLALLDRAAMSASIQQLPRPLRQVIHLRYVAGLSVQETATRLSVPEGTVRRRCFEACRLLEQRFLRHHLRPAEGDCAVVADQLCRAAGRDLSPLARRRVALHLIGCPGCQARQAELAVTFGELARHRRRPQLQQSGPQQQAQPGILAGAIAGAIAG